MSYLQQGILYFLGTNYNYYFMNQSFTTGFTPQKTPSSDEKTLGLLAHILTFVAPILAPLLIYLVKKDESEYVTFHAKESLNFQISVVIYVILLFISIVGILLIWVLGIAVFVLVILATIKASEGKLYKYPLCIRFIK